MTWNPEISPHPEAPARTRMEWLVRSFRKISEWSRTRVPAGSGALLSSAPVIVNQVLSTSWVKISVFDAELTGPGCAIDLANNRLAITERGRWFFNLNCNGEITPFSSNDAQAIKVAIYNETQSAVLAVAYSPVPRYGDVFDTTVTEMVDMPLRNGLLDIGDWISVWVRQRYPTPVITVDEVELVSLDVFRVGE